MTSGASRWYALWQGLYGESRQNSRLDLANKSSIMAIKRPINVSLIFNKQYYNIFDEIK